jgi:uncharacterized protein (UPF0548 family)
MLSLSKPSAESIRSYLSAQAKLDFTYTAIGATAAKPPDSYVLDHIRVKLGDGETVYKTAKLALERWEQFNLGWLATMPPETPIKSGEVVAVVARAFSLYWVNPCRIVYVIHEAGPVFRFGFAYGTLPGHVETGEERFLIEWHQREGSVYYDVLAFSRPRHFLTRIGYRRVRRMQKRFGQESAAAMLQAVHRPH